MFDHIHLSPQCLPNLSPHFFPQLVVLSNFLTHEVQFVAFTHSCLWGFPLEHGWLTTLYTLSKNCFSLSQKLWIAKNSMARCASSWLYSFSCWCLAWLELGQVLCMSSHPLWVYIYTCRIVGKRWFFYLSLWHLYYYSSLFHSDSWACGGGCAVKRATEDFMSYSLQCGQCESS